MEDNNYLRCFRLTYFSCENSLRSLNDVLFLITLSTISCNKQSTSIILIQHFRWVIFWWLHLQMPLNESFLANEISKCLERLSSNPFIVRKTNLKFSGTAIISTETSSWDETECVADTYTFPLCSIVSRCSLHMLRFHYSLYEKLNLSQYYYGGVVTWPSPIKQIDYQLYTCNANTINAA